MKTIVKTEFYELSYNDSKDWIYWTMKGYWSSMEIVADFEKDWETAISKVKTPFRIFADLTTLGAMPDDVKAANDQMQQKLLQKGCIKVAVTIESAITQMSVNRVIKESGMDKIVQYFDNLNIARKWLAE